MRSSGLSSLAWWKRERGGFLSSAMGGRLACPRDFAKTEAWHPRCRHGEEPQATRQSPARGQARPIAGDCFAALAMTMLAAVTVAAHVEMEMIIMRGVVVGSEHCAEAADRKSTRLNSSH